LELVASTVEGNRDAPVLVERSKEGEVIEDGEEQIGEEGVSEGNRGEVYRRRSAKPPGKVWRCALGSGNRKMRGGRDQSGVDK
jgi:hypothetical protein